MTGPGMTIGAPKRPRWITPVSLALAGTLAAACGTGAAQGPGGTTTSTGSAATTTTVFSISPSAASKALVVGGIGGSRTNAYLVDTAVPKVMGTVGFGPADANPAVAMSADAAEAWVCTRDPALDFQTVVYPLDLSNFSANPPIPLGTKTFNLGCAGIAAPSPGHLLAEVGNSLIEVNTSNASHRVVASLPGTEAGQMRFDAPAGTTYIPRQIGTQLELLPFTIASSTLGAPITLSSLAPAQVAGIVFAGAGLAWALVTRSGSISGSWIVPVRTAAHTAGNPIALPAGLIPDSLTGNGDSLYLLASPGPLQGPAIYGIQPPGSTPQELLALPRTWAADIKIAAGRLVVTMGTSAASAAIGVFDPAAPSGLTSLSVPMAPQAGPGPIAVAE